jgi:hypothetical protein
MSGENKHKLRQQQLANAVAAAAAAAETRPAAPTARTETVEV